MIPSHILQAIKESCAFGKESCLLYSECEPVRQWIGNHKAHVTAMEFPVTGPERDARIECSKRGGKNTARKRGYNLK